MTDLRVFGRIGARLSQEGYPPDDLFILFFLVLHHMTDQ